MVKDELMVTLL